MKKSCIVILYIILFMVSAPAQSTSAEKGSKAPETKPQSSVLKEDKDKLSYALGMRMALELKVLRKTVDFDPNLVAQGLRDSLVRRQNPADR